MTWLTSMFRRLMHERHDEGRADTLRPGETVARAGAEAFDQRVAFLAEASGILSSSLEYEATLSTVAHLAVPHLADWCAVDLVQCDGPVHRVAVAHVDPTHVQVALDLQRRYPFTPDAPYGPAKVLRTGRSELYPQVTDAMLVAVAQDATHLETLRWAGLTSGMCVPLVARGRTLGVLSFGSTKAGRMYGADDLALAEDLAHRAALAVDNARLYDETRQSDARHRAIIETALDCIITVDVTGRIVEFNPAAERTFGLARAEAIGRDLVELIVPPALRAAHQEGLQRYLATGETRILGRRVEMSALRADGSEFPAELAIAHVATSGPPLFTAYLRDLSERKKLEAAREEAAALRSVSALAAAAAHEINNPLSVVVAQAAFLAREIGGPGRGRLDAIRNAAGKIAEILTDMSQIVSLQHVPSRPYLPDMLDLRRSIARTVPDSGEGPARTP
jgi:PAS domain S-box-containing protein